MLIINYFQNYYQGKRYKETPGRVTEATIIDIRAKSSSEKQRNYHRALIKFLQEKGQPTSLFDNPKSSKDASAKIRAMITVINKNGWNDEFFVKKEG